MDYFYSDISVNVRNQDFLEKLKNFSEKMEQQVYVLKGPLTDSKYAYDIKDACIVLTRNRKIAFVSFTHDNDSLFDDYKQDVLEDIGSLSDVYDYRKVIGRTRVWEDKITLKCFIDEIDNFDTWINQKLMLNSEDSRLLELVITLFIGSINDVTNITIDKNLSVLQKVKQKIQLFDGQQTRFIYGDLESFEKRITIQGLSGTGKTELLLHKLKEVYLKNPSLPIGITCHNKVLADSLGKRILGFFDSMQVKRQFDPEKILCVNAWGKAASPMSGIYRYICEIYNLEYLNFRQSGSFDSACKNAINQLSKQSIDKYAFSYIFIDESQDFDDSFFELCELVTKEKVYVAGDVFQSIFEEHSKHEAKPTFLLSNCYRTDPKTLMIAHALGLGLYEEKKFWWLSDEEWIQCGYNLEKKADLYKLSRYPIHRFDEDEDDKKCFSLKIINDLNSSLLKILEELGNDFPDIKPDDLGIIFLDDESYIYDCFPKVERLLYDSRNWEANIAFETKKKEKGKVFVTNRNNAKGLEFPIVICITSGLKSTIAYRNTLYTMLTRSFLRSYLLVSSKRNGISYDIINGIEETLKNKKITVKAPSASERESMHKWMITARRVESLKDRIDKAFMELGIFDLKTKENIEAAINVEKFKDADYKKILQLIEALKEMV